ncbi:MAG TPA: thioredoxin domain-containing protein [Nitrospira sp.]
MAEGHVHEAALLITDHDHVEGEAAAPATLVEYGDFECPYSREAVTTIQALQREFGHELRFVFRHFPLAHKHSHAVQAAEAAEAAAAQGKFWAMYATLFSHQWELEYRDLMDYAGQLELDRTRFSEALNKHKYLDRVRADVGTGQQHGVTGTPTFFINGRRQGGDDDVRALRTAIRNALRV